MPNLLANGQNSKEDAAVLCNHLKHGYHGYHVHTYFIAQCKVSNNIATDSNRLCMLSSSSLLLPFTHTYKSCTIVSKLSITLQAQAQKISLATLYHKLFQKGPVLPTTGFLLYLPCLKFSSFSVPIGSAIENWTQVHGTAPEYQTLLLLR